MLEIFVDCLSYDEYEKLQLELELFEKVFVELELENRKTFQN